MDLNSLNLTGRLGRDPELRQTPGGATVCNFPMAANGYKDETVWVDVATWGKGAEACAQYLGKGSRVAVSGELRVRDYEKSDGTPGRAIECANARVTFLDSKSDAPAQAAPAPAQTSAPADDDDIPF